MSEVESTTKAHLSPCATQLKESPGKLKNRTTETAFWYGLDGKAPSVPKTCVYGTDYLPKRLPYQKDAYLVREADEAKNGTGEGDSTIPINEYNQRIYDGNQRSTRDAVTD